MGSGTAAELRTWTRIYAELPDIEDIFNGKMPAMPKSTDAMYALSASMTAYAREHRTELSKIANSIRYADKMPPDFSALVLRDYLFLEPDYKLKLMKIPEFQKWLTTKGSLLNGIV